MVRCLGNVQMLAVDKLLRNSSLSMASGERVNAKPASRHTWFLPRVRTVTQDVQLQASYEHRRSIINNIVFKDLLRLRELLLGYRQLVYVQPHKLHKLDAKIRYLDDMVDAFIEKWTYKTNSWSASVNSNRKEFPIEYAKLIQELIKFIAKAKNVTQYAYSLHRPVVREHEG